MLIGDEPLQGAAHPVEFVGPDAHGYGNMVQFFTYGGDISAWRAAEIVLGGRYTDKRMFIVDTAWMAAGLRQALGARRREKNARRHLLDRPHPSYLHPGQPFAPLELDCPTRVPGCSCPPWRQLVCFEHLCNQLSCFTIS